MKILWTGSFSDPTGYGQATRLFVRELRKLTNVTAIDKSFSNRHGGPLSKEFEDLYTYNEKEEYDIHIQAYTPDFFNKLPNIKINIGLTMFETDSLPGFWGKYLAQMDKVIVPTQWGADIFSKYMNKDKLIVSPLSYDRDWVVTSDSENLCSQLADQKDKRIVLCCCDYNTRKGIKEIYKAVNMAPDDLFFILRFAPVQVSSNAILEDASMHIHRNNYAIIPQFVTDRTIANLMYISDFLLFPTRGEGFGLPILESMAHGTPVVATGWSAHTSFLNNTNGKLIDYTLETIDPGSMITGSMLYYGHKWAIPTDNGLKDAVRFMSDISEENLMTLRKKAKETAEEYSADKSAKKLYNQLEKLM